MNAFLGCTKYHIITCINLINTKYREEDNIFVIYDFEGNLYELYSRISISMRNIKIFYIDGISTNNLILNYLKYIKLFNKEFKNCYCSKFFVHGFNPYAEIIYSILKKKNKKIEYICYEEGLGSYVLETCIKNLSIKQRILLSFFTFRILKKREYNLLLYEPMLLCVNNYDMVKLEKLEKIQSFNNEYYNYIFNYKKEFDYNEKVIYLEQIYTNFHEFDELENKLIEQLKINFKDDFIIKRHPRSNKNYKLKCIEDKSPWELVCMNNKIEDRILISVNSTACITPKVLFDKEPIIIILAKIFPDDLNIANHVCTLFEKLENTYKNKNRVFIPNNFDELNKIFDYIKIN